MNGPLSGFRVIEATQMVSGPLGAMLLADLGADVVKIEQPVGGDRIRYVGHRRAGMGALFSNVNRGKRSVVLDLTVDAGREALFRLIETADVFIQNFRPGVADRLGIGYSALAARRPDLIYVSIAGFGDDGPYTKQKTYDYVVQALSGMAMLQTDPVSGEPALLRNIVIDKVTAYTAAQAVTAALLARERGAGGQHVKLSMLDTALAFLWPDGMMQHTLLGDGVTEAAHMADDYQVCRTTDGWITAMPVSDRQFPPAARALGRADWLDDPRFATADARNANGPDTRAALAAEFAKRSTADVVALMVAADVPCAPLNDVADVYRDPQVVHNETLVEYDAPWIGRVRHPRPAIKFSTTPQDNVGRHAPKLDEHTDEVLAELGFTPDEVATMRASGASGVKRAAH